MKKFCGSLRKQAINFKKIKKKFLINKQQELYENEKMCYICKEKLEDKYIQDKKYYKVRNNCHCTGEYIDSAHSICNSKNSVPKEISIVFYN